MIGSVPPALLFVGGALLIPFLKGRIRSAYLLLLPVLGFINLLAIPPDSSFPVQLRKILVIFSYDRIQATRGLVYE